MNIIAINGIPRMNHNTAELLNHAVEGAKSKGANVETIHLYRLNYKGCHGCFSCKRKESPSLHNCAIKDDLTDVLEKIKNADGIILASPIYFYDLTGEMRSFLERLLFPNLPYDISVKEGTYFPRELKVACLYTMGASEDMVKDRVKPMEDFLCQMFRTSVKSLYSSLDYPFLDDFSHYESSNLENALERRQNVFPQDCQKAYQLGIDFVGE